MIDGEKTVKNKVASRKELIDLLAAAIDGIDGAEAETG